MIKLHVLADDNKKYIEVNSLLKGLKQERKSVMKALKKAQSYNLDELVNEQDMPVRDAQLVNEISETCLNTALNMTFNSLESIFKEVKGA